jgi:Mn2+/Fe2+ NRAMP family transporter
MTRKIVLAALAVVVAFAILLAAAAALVFATLRVERIANPLAHAAAAGAELIFGAALLLAGVYIATRFAVHIFAITADITRPNHPAAPSQTSRATQ